MCIEKAAQQTMINVYRARAPLYEIVNGRQRMLTVSHTLVTKVPGVLRRDAMVARHFAVVVCPSVRHKPVLYRDDWTNRAGFGTEISFHLSHTVIRKFGYLQKIGYFPVELCPRLRTPKISPRQVDRVVSKTRRRSSLLTTPTRQSTSRGCLLQVDQL